MRVLFCHGLESGPHGRKFHALEAAGFDVVSPDCRNRDLSTRLEILTHTIARQRPHVVVGSSFGGIAGLLASIEARGAGTRIDGLLLCAPALQLPPPPSFTGTIECPAPTIVLHGARDEVIPVEIGRAFAQTHGARMVEVDDDHSLAASLDRIVELVGELGSPL